MGLRPDCVRDGETGPESKNSFPCRLALQVTHTAPACIAHSAVSVYTGIEQPNLHMQSKTADPLIQANQPGFNEHVVRK